MCNIIRDCFFRIKVLSIEEEANNEREKTTIANDCFPLFVDHDIN